MRNMKKMIMVLTLAVTMQVGVGAATTEASPLHLGSSQQLVQLHSGHHDNGNHYGEHKNKHHHHHDKYGNDIIEGVIIGIAIAEAID